MSTPSVIRMPEPDKSADIFARFEKAYRAAGVNISFGEFVKAAGVLAAALLVVGTIAFSGRSPEELLIGVFLAIAGGLVLYSLGAILSAQGYMLRATLDAAVSSSSQLSSAAKAKLASLAQSA